MGTPDVLHFIELSEADYDAFASEHPRANFLQSPGIGRRRIQSGWRPNYLGLSDGKNVVAAGLFQSRPVFARYCDVECQEGPLLDYANTSLLQQYLKEVVSYWRYHHALTVRINPPFTIRYYDGDAELIREESSAVGDTFTANGFRQLDNVAVDHNPDLLRWYFTKDLSAFHSIDELMPSLDQQTRWSINKAHKFGVKVRTLDTVASLSGFYEIIRATGERLGFQARDIAYYESMFQEFPRHQAMFTEAYLDIAAYRSSLKEQIAEQDHLLASLDEKDQKLQGRRKEALAQRTNYQQKLAGIDRLADGAPEIRLACALFMHYGGELVYFSSGTDEKYKAFNGAYALQYWALNYALTHRISRYNFYGTNGSFNQHPEQEGVYRFKRGFGGTLEEQLGYFVATPHPLTKHLVDVIRHVKNLIKKS